MSVCAAAHVRIAEILGAVVEAVPAVDKRSARGGSSARDAVGGFEAHGERYSGAGCAFGAESDTLSDSGAKAVGCDVGIILGVGQKSDEGEGSGAGSLVCASAGSETVNAIFNQPLGGIATLGPVEVGRGRCGVGNYNVGNLRTIGTDFQCDVVDISIPCSGANGSDGYVVAVTVEIVESDRVLLPMGIVADGDTADQLEGAVVVGVGHHTHLEDGVVAGAG